MKVRSISVVLGTALTLLTGCSANVGTESTGSASEPALSGPGNPLYPVTYTTTVECGGTGKLSDGPSPWNQNEADFMWALYLDGCGLHGSDGYYQFVHGSDGSAAATTFCPAGHVAPSYIAYWSAPAQNPVHAEQYYSGSTICSNGAAQIPAGWTEVDFDPNCTGSYCGTVTTSGQKI